MGNTAYLARNSGGNSEVLFESNNAIPLFWLNLLDKDFIDKVEKEIIENYNKNETLIINIPKKVFMKNLYSGKALIEKYYIDKINLYNDFINYLDKTFNENDLLELDISEITNFYKNIKLLIKHLKAGITDKDFKYSENIFSFVGYDGFCNNEFINYSKEYLEYCQHEDEERELYKKQVEKQKAKKKIKDFIGNISMCIVGFVFLLGCIFMTLKQGISFVAIGGIIFGILCSGAGILKIKEII